jgi:hypothetical protein
VINPECIVVGGLALRFGEDLLGPARSTVVREALGGSAEACYIVPAALGEQIGDVAAVCAAIQGISRTQRQRLLHPSVPPPSSSLSAKYKTGKETVEPEIIA